MSPHYSTRQEDGFSLVEILVVILIIGILTAVAVPAFPNQRKAANDAKLESDLKNVATIYKTWALNHSNQDFADRAGTMSTGFVRQSMYVLGDGTTSTLTIQDQSGPATRGVTLWNDVIDNPKITISPGSAVEIIVRTKISEGESLTDEDEFCLAGTSDDSTWNYVVGTSPANKRDIYEKTLFYDSGTGGVHTIQELANTPDINTKPCGLHVKRYNALPTN